MKKALSSILFVIFLSIFLYSGYRLYLIFSEYHRGTSSYKETASQSVTIRLRVRIPHPGRSRLQINRKALNIRWEIPEEAPTTEEALLLLAATEMIL